jgi:hypothetical protein
VASGLVDWWPEEPTCLRPGRPGAAAAALHLTLADEARAVALREVVEATAPAAWRA